MFVWCIHLFRKKIRPRILFLETIILVFTDFEKKNHKNVLIGHLNISSIKNKFETLTKGKRNLVILFLTISFSLMVVNDFADIVIR